MNIVIILEVGWLSVFTIQPEPNSCLCCVWPDQSDYSAISVLCVITIIQCRTCLTYSCHTRVGLRVSEGLAPVCSVARLQCSCYTACGEARKCTQHLLIVFWHSVGMYIIGLSNVFKHFNKHSRAGFSWSVFGRLLTVINASWKKPRSRYDNRKNKV